MADKQGVVKRRPRFSLLNLLLVMTIAAMGLALLRERQQRVPLQEQVLQLRREAGIAEGSDPKKLSAIRLKDSFDPQRQIRWRVYVPLHRFAEAQLRVEGSGGGSGGGVGLTASRRYMWPHADGWQSGFRAKTGYTNSRTAVSPVNPRSSLLLVNSIKEVGRMN